jgi:hypothetical protein
LLQADGVAIINIVGRAFPFKRRGFKDKRLGWSGVGALNQPFFLLWNTTMNFSFTTQSGVISYVRDGAVAGGGALDASYITDGSQPVIALSAAPHVADDLSYQLISEAETAVSYINKQNVNLDVNLCKRQPTADEGRKHVAAGAGHVTEPNPQNMDEGKFSKQIAEAEPSDQEKVSGRPVAADPSSDASNSSVQADVANSDATDADKDLVPSAGRITRIKAQVFPSKGLHKRTVKLYIWDTAVPEDARNREKSTTAFFNTSEPAEFKKKLRANKKKAHISDEEFGDLMQAAEGIFQNNRDNRLLDEKDKTTIGYLSVKSPNMGTVNCYHCFVVLMWNYDREEKRYMPIIGLQIGNKSFVFDDVMATNNTNPSAAQFVAYYDPHELWRENKSLK